MSVFHYLNVGILQGNLLSSLLLYILSPLGKFLSFPWSFPSFLFSEVEDQTRNDWGFSLTPKFCDCLCKIKTPHRFPPKSFPPLSEFSVYIKAIVLFAQTQNLDMKFDLKMHICFVMTSVDGSSWLLVIFFLPFSLPFYKSWFPFLLLVCSKCSCCLRSYDF